MRLILLLLPFLVACIDGSRDGSADDADTSDASDASDVADTRSEVDTGGVRCGKCVQVWHFDFTSGCVIDNASGAECCPNKGDTGCCPADAPVCPVATAGYEWRECSDVREAFGRVFCKDDDAYVSGHTLSSRGALCTTEETGCGTGSLPDEP